MKKIFILLALAAITFCMVLILQKKAKAELEEELTDELLTLSGTIPSWLSGTLIRNGPVYVTVNGQTNAHWFDGLAMLHAFTFHEGKVLYSNKFLRTEAYKTVFKKGSLNYKGFASDPCRSIFKRFFTWLVPHSAHLLPNANVNVAKLADAYVALTEIPLPVSFDLKTLETLGALDYQDQLPHDKCWESAHPHHDLAKEETLNYLIQYGRISNYLLYRLKDGSSKREILAQIPVREPAYMHSFAVTEHFVILTEYPFVVKPLDLITKKQSFIKNFTWHPERGTEFIVIDRASGEVIGRYKTKPFFAFHHANAFEKNCKIYLDIICYDDPSIITQAARLHQASEHSPTTYSQRLMRFTLSLETGELNAEEVCNRPCEFPRLNEQFDGRPYRFAYLADPRDPSLDHLGSCLYKIDVETKEVKQWREEDCFPGEPVFVSSPGSTEEDEGVILSVVLDVRQHASFLLVLDGKSFIEIGRAKVSHAIPAGLHGQYFSALLPN